MSFFRGIVVVIEREDRTLASTPFYVHFGKFKILDAEGKIIDIFNRNEITGVNMKLNVDGVGKVFREGFRNSGTESQINIVRNEKMNNSVVVEERRDLLDSEDEEKECFSEPISIFDEEEEKRSMEMDKNLTSDELRQLRLSPGLNMLFFVVRDNPKVYLPCKVYLWDYRTKIVISDIDGTITKSDLMGHLCYLLGMDWTKGGAVYFFNILAKRGYKLLYLSARSLNQLDSTRNYLAGIKQEKMILPDGPLFLNPCGLIKALVSEMAKKSRFFKENTLMNLRILFNGRIPFHSGIGNRAGDGLAYEAIGIPREMNFIINKHGKEKGEFVSIKNFKDTKLDIDRFFPPIIR
jgi:phosphatidate phosphatase PAH1